jgi:hypothetical protein
MERHTRSNIQIMESKAHEIDQACITGIISRESTLWGTYQHVIPYVKQKT